METLPLIIYNESDQLTLDIIQNYETMLKITHFYSFPDENSFKLDDNSQNSLLPQINIPDQRIDDREILETQSKFLNYFVYATIFCIVSYLLFHNKKKILALVLEGRRKQPSGKFTLWKI